MSNRSGMLAAFCSLALLPLAAPGAEVHLADGRVLEGDILSAPGANELAIRTRNDGMEAVIRVPAAQVQRLNADSTPRELALAAFAKKAAALIIAVGDAPAWWTLSQEAKTLNQPSLARKYAQQTIRFDPDHEAARTFLGFERVDGHWLKGADAQVAKGNVLYRGQWLTPAARDALVADETRIAADEADRRKKRLADLEVAKQEAAVAAAKRDAEAPPLENTAVFGTYTTTPSVLFLQSGRWPAFPQAVCPQPVTRPGPTVEIQGHGYGWNLHYRK